MLERFVGSLLAGALIVATPLGVAPLVSAPSPHGTERIVFTAKVKNTTDPKSAIYVADGDGGNVSKLPMDDSLSYEWAAWAMNGTKIVYTAHAPVQQPDRADIMLMDPDGSNRVRLTTDALLQAQPKISPDGRWLYFTASWNEYPRAAIFRMDLATFEVVDLTARSGILGGFDTDPKLSADGSTIAFVVTVHSSVAKGPFATQVSVMDANGLGRRNVTDDGWFNTDPSISPDGREIAYTSYRGSVVPTSSVLSPWYLAVVDVKTGEQRLLTKGLLCTSAVTTCGPADGAAFIAQWSLDGRRIGYISVRSALLSGIYVMDRDGGNPRALIESSTLGIEWWDWTTVGVPPAGAVERIGSARPATRLLYAARQSSGTGPLQLFTASADRWTSTAVDVPGLSAQLRSVRWTPDRQRVLITATGPIGDVAPFPAPPSGEVRHEHFNLDSIGRLQSPEAQTSRDISAAQEQIYIANIDGSGLRQVTTPWIEDYMDAVPTGDARGNADPDMSPDGRYVVFTNLSTLSFESFILRLDLQTGEVINLTSMTAGDLPVADAKPRISPDGRRIVFTSAVGDLATGDVTTQLFVMNIDGTQVRQITDDAYAATDPAWSPDGRTIAFSSYHGTAALDPQVSTGSEPAGWILETLDLATGSVAELTTIDQPSAFRPAWYPTGTKIGFLSAGPQGQPDIYVVDAAGGEPQPLQTTLVSQEAFFDWR